MGRKRSSSDAPSSNNWGSVRWGQVFRYQTHGGWLVLIAALVILGIGHYKVKPSYRPLTLYDASISLPSHPDTVSITLAGIIPAVALLITVAAVEFGAMYKRQSLTMAIHAFCHIIWWAVIGFVVVLAITEATKPFASRYRPDYMSRCKPVGAVPNKTPLAFETRTDCDPSLKNLPETADGRKSFPSGHSSNSMSLCWFTILYLVHALYWREGLSYMGSIWGGRSCGRRLLAELLQGLFICWGLAVLSIAWVIGVTRFRDNKHNIDDILGGFIAALLWMTPCTFIALGQLNYYQQQLRRLEKGGDGSVGTAVGATPKDAAAGSAAVDDAAAAAADYTALTVKPADAPVVATARAANGGGLSGGPGSY